MELLSRRAFTESEILMSPQDASQVKLITAGDGGAFIDSYIGYYGLPAEYRVFFEELANARLGYFALAGIARTGYWDEPWFKEALARTGYSATAKTQLLRMYMEQVTQTRILPVMPQARRLYREGFISRERMGDILSRAAGSSNLGDIRLEAVDLEREYELLALAQDISLYAFSRGMITEGECTENLSGFMDSGEMISLQILREQVGLVRRITISLPEPERAPLQIVEE